MINNNYDNNNYNNGNNNNDKNSNNNNSHINNNNNIDDNNNSNITIAILIAITSYKIMMKNNDNVNDDKIVLKIKITKSN